MDEKLQEILDEYAEDINRYKTERDKLISKMEFCNMHNLNEEWRITQVRFDSVNMIIYRWENMHNEIQKILNAWNS